MSFAAPQAFWLLVLVPGLAYLYQRAQRRRHVVLARFGQTAEPTLRGRATCRLAALVLLISALAQPQWGQDTGSSAQQGRDLVFLLDVSLSMLATDAPPSRLQFAKDRIRDFIDTTLRPRGGYRVSLLIFAGRARLQCPLTLDYDLFLQRLEAAKVDDAPQRGTQIESVLYQAMQSTGLPDPEYADMIIFSDGEDHDGLSADASHVLNEQGIALYAFGVGDPIRGTPIPLGVQDEQGRTTLHVQEREIYTQLNQSLLLQLAQSTQGQYQLASTTALEDVFHNSIAPKPIRDLASSAEAQPAPRFAWFLLPALLLLALEQRLLWPWDHRKEVQREKSFDAS